MNFKINAAVVWSDNVAKSEGENYKQLLALLTHCALGLTQNQFPRSEPQ